MDCRSPQFGAQWWGERWWVLTPPPVMKSNTSSKNTPINNDTCVVNTGLYSGYIGSEQDKSSSLFGSICVPFFFSYLQSISWPRPTLLAVVINNAAKFRLNFCCTTHPSAWQGRLDEMWWALKSLVKIGHYKMPYEIELSSFTLTKTQHLDRWDHYRL